MSAKERLLSSAQKFILKGQFDKAVKDYEQVVAIDSDIRHRQKLAELLVRSGRKDDAVKEYVRIADYYANNGFYLKSIAVYKQIQKITPSDINVTIALASLNHKQGLKGNALAEYKTAVDYYERRGEYSEAAKILDTMAGIDTENPNIRHKLAETLFSGGDAEESYRSFMNLALFLRNQGNKEGVERIHARIQRLFPERTDFVFDLINAQINNGSPLEAVPRLKQLVKNDPRQRRPWDLLLEAYKAAGDRASRKAVSKQMIKFFPDDPSPREELITCCIQDEDIEEGLGALGDYSDRFLLKGRKDSVEMLYRKFYEIAPDNVRVLEELQDYYGRTGQDAKQSDILARLAILSSTDTFDEPHEELFPEEISPMEPVQPEPISSESGPWEEEIDLSLSDDYYLDIDFDGVEQETLAALEAGVEAPALVGDETPAVSIDDLGSENEEDFEPFTADEIDASFLTLSDSGIDAPDDETESTSMGSDTIGFEGMLAETTPGVKLQTEVTETETHYDLGIAYKEMGLWNEAIAEFLKAAADPERRIDCLVLQGLCYREKGDVKTAEKVMRDGLDVGGMTFEERAAVEYELGSLYERLGRYADALSSYKNSSTASPGFRDAEEKVAALSSLVGDVPPATAEVGQINLDEAL